MNQDFLKRFPNQNAENRGTECVGESVADLIGNLNKIPMHAGYNYATALWCARSGPTTGGSDPYAGMIGGIVYGSLPIKDQDFDATTTSELFEANIENYSAEDRATALTFAQNGLKRFYTYQQVVDWLALNKGGVSLSIKFYNSFLSPNQDGTLPSPLGNFTYHNVDVYEETDKGLRAKMWLGPTYGDEGYVYITETVLNLIFYYAYAFDPDASRWWSLALIGCTRPWLLSDILPQLSKTQSIMPPQNDNLAANGQGTATQKPNLLTTFCTALRDYEGKVGDLNYRNNNPGNCRCSKVGYLPKYGNVTCVNGFAHFPTYELGWEYLQALVRDRIWKNPLWDFYDFFSVWAPRGDGGNNPVIYAKNVAARCGVEPTVVLSTIIY